MKQIKARITGEIKNNGIEVQNLRLGQSSAVTNTENGSADIIIFDENNDQIKKYTVPTAFVGSGGGGIINDVIIADIPFPDSAIALTIRAPDPSGEKQLETRIVPTARWLRQLIKNIPDEAFIPSPSGSRRQLENRLDTTKRHIEGKRYQPAANVLRSMKRDIKEIVKKDYKISRAGQPTRSEVIDGIEREIDRLDGMNSPRSGKQN